MAENWWKRNTKGLKGTIIYVLLGFLIALLLNKGLGLVLGSPLPVVTVSSTSMVPTLQVGDISIIYGRGGYNLEDIIVFKGWKPEPIIHRVVGKAEKTNGEIKIEVSNRLNKLSEEELRSLGEKHLSKSVKSIYITKGDNNGICDQCYGKNVVKESEIYGKSILKIPLLGWVKILFINLFLHNPLIGFPLAFIAIAIYFILKP